MSVQRTCLNPVSCFRESLEVSPGSMQTRVNVLICGYKPLQVPDPTILSQVAETHHTASLKRIGYGPCTQIL